MTRADLVAGDVGAKVVVTIRRKSTGLVMDLTGCTVVFRMSFANAAAITRNATVTSAAGGVVEYAFATGELVQGSLELEATVTQAGVVLTTLEIAQLTVRPRLA